MPNIEHITACTSNWTNNGSNFDNASATDAFKERMVTVGIKFVTGK